jgi:hypothetical protein
MKKTIVILSAFFMLFQTIPAEAHVGAISYGNSLVAGQSSRIFLSLGHGCTYKNARYGTSIFQVDVPATAGKPTPAYVPGFRVTNVASKDLLANGAPKSYQVTWTALAKSKIIPDGTFFDFGLKVKWDSNPQVIYFPVTQTCFASDKTPLYLVWNIVDGSTKAATSDTEYGPAPSVTTVKA